MKRWIHAKEEISAMANVNKVRTGLNVNIWSDGQGYKRHKPDHEPRVKLDGANGQISVSISEDPKVLAPRDWRKKFKKSDLDDFDAGIDYVKRNHDLFEKHYFDQDFSFDDQTLFEKLSERGDYR